MLRTVTRCNSGGQCVEAPALLQSGPDASRARRSDCFQPRATARRSAPLTTVRVLSADEEAPIGPSQTSRRLLEGEGGSTEASYRGKAATKLLRRRGQGRLLCPARRKTALRPSLERPSTAAISQKERARRSRALK